MFAFFSAFFPFKSRHHMPPLLLLLLEKWQSFKINSFTVFFFVCFFIPPSLLCQSTQKLKKQKAKSKKHNSARNAICVQYGETIKNAVYNERAAGLMKRLRRSAATLRDPHMKRDAVDRMPTKPPSCRFEVTQKNSAIWRRRRRRRRRVLSL